MKRFDYLRVFIFDYHVIYQGILRGFPNFVTWAHNFDHFLIFDLIMNLLRIFDTLGDENSISNCVIKSTAHFGIKTNEVIAGVEIELG